MKSGQNKVEEVTFWDAESGKKKYLRFEKKVYSAFRIKEYQEMIDISTRNYPLLNDARILDLGCSAGVSTIVWSKLGYDATGVDISPGLIDKARELASFEKEETRFLVGDIASLDFDNETFDVCFMAGLLHHIPDYTTVLSEIRRVLKPGGILIAIEPNLESWPYMFSFKLVHRQKGVTLNEYPLSPVKVKKDISPFFDNICLHQFRQNDIPFLRQLGFWGQGLIGKTTAFICRRIKNSLGNEYSKGTFFIITGVK